MKKIDKKINMAELIEKYPEAKDVLVEMGLGCVGCVASQFETLEEGLMAHGLDVDVVLNKINKTLEK